MTKRWKVRPEGSTWGDWGDDDQLGRVNLITPQKVLEGVAEVKEGLSFCLSLPLNLPGGTKLNPARGPYTLRPTELPDGSIRYLYPACLDDPHFTDVGSDDRVDMVLQYATQWDTFAHVGSMFDANGDGERDIRFYNGYQGHIDVKGPVKYNLDGTIEQTGDTTGARKLGVENMAEKGMQGRGVLVDLERHFGETRHYVGYDDWMRALEAANVEVTPGDMLLIYTGFADYIMELPIRVSRFFAPITTRWKASPPAPPWQSAMPACRCMSSACSSWALTWGSFGIWVRWQSGCASIIAPGSYLQHRRCAYLVR